MRFNSQNSLSLSRLRPAVMAAHPATELVGLVMVTVTGGSGQQAHLQGKHSQPLTRQELLLSLLAKSLLPDWVESVFSRFRDKGECWSRDTRANEKPRGRNYPISRLSWAGLGVTGGGQVTLSLHTLIRGAEAMWSPTQNLRIRVAKQGEEEGHWGAGRLWL